MPLFLLASHLCSVSAVTMAIHSLTNVIFGIYRALSQARRDAEDGFESNAHRRSWPLAQPAPYADNDARPLFCNRPVLFARSGGRRQWEVLGPLLPSVATARSPAGTPCSAGLMLRCCATHRDGRTCSVSSH